MAKTAVADVIIPTEFERYAIERTAELSRFGDSGIVEHDPAFDDIAMQGREVKMPFWKDLTATRRRWLGRGTRTGGVKANISTGDPPAAMLKVGQDPNGVPERLTDRTVGGSVLANGVI